MSPIQCPVCNARLVQPYEREEWVLDGGSDHLADALANAEDALSPKEYRWKDVEQARQNGFIAGFAVATAFALIGFWMIASRQ